MKPENQFIYITGGKSRKGGAKLNEWNRFDSAQLLRLNLNTLTCEKVFEYKSPIENCPNESQSHVFKAGYRDDNFLYLCTQTEILILDAEMLGVHRKISLPIFNDLHHVRPDGKGNILAVSTGLDMVARLTMSGDILEEWSVFGAPVWERYDQAVDYRKILSTKPHPSHPNYVFLTDDKVWVTRHFQKDAICLDDPSLTIKIDIEKPHDGNTYHGAIFFTTVDGHVVEIDQKTRKTLRAIDLRSIYGDQRPLGFCRGIHVFDSDRVIVGFSRLRETDFQRNVSWVKDQLKQATRATPNLTSMETRVALINIRRNKVEWDAGLEQYDLHAVFSIF